MKRTLEQRRAEDALARVKDVKKLAAQRKKIDAEKYRSYVDRLGPAIVMNGLGQAMATELAADDDAHRKLYDNVRRWLCRRDGGVYSGSDDLLTSIMRDDEHKYLRAQAEVLAWLEWHKKLCRAYFRTSKGKS